MPPRPQLAGSTIALLTTLACQHPAPDHHGEHVDVVLDDDIQICAGELARSDGFIEHIFEVWTGAPPDDFHLELRPVHDLAGAPCNANSGGCTSNSKLWLDNQNSQDFLAARAMVRFTDPRSAPLLDPGVPIAFAPFSSPTYLLSQVQEIEPSLLAEPNPDAYDAGKLALVARYLIDRFGSTPLRDYLHAMAPAEQRTPEGFANEFSQAFGEPLDVAWADFQSAPRCLYDFRFCDAGTPIELPFGLDGIDCDDPDTFGYSAPVLEQQPDRPYQPQKIFLLDNPTPRTVTIEQGAGSVIIIACGSCAHELFVGSDPTTAELELDAGTYAMLASGTEGDVQLSITPR